MKKLLLFTFLAFTFLGVYAQFTPTPWYTTGNGGTNPSSNFIGTTDKLPTLNEVEQFINENQHLPNVPSAAQVEANGLNIGEMNAILIQKVEELTLYILDLQKQINALKQTK